MKRLLTLAVVMIVAAAATGCNLFNRNSCDPCATGYGAGSMGGDGYADGAMVAPGASYGAAPVVTNGGYLPTPN
jgi:hypothetical protein